MFRKTNGLKSLYRDIASRRFPWHGEWAIAFFDVAACADESGIHDGASVCVLAGYVAGVRQWVRFENAWERVLKRFGVADFHSKEFFAFNASGQRVGRYKRFDDHSAKECYGGWPAERIDKFQTDLLSVVHSSSIQPIGGMIDVRAFLALAHGERRFLTGGVFDGKRFVSSGAPTKPYFLLFDHFIIVAARATKPGKRLLCVFDRQKQYQAMAIELFQDSAHRIDANGILSGVIYHDRLDAPGLQAADLYAHCWHRYSTNNDSLSGPRREALDVLTRKRDDMQWYTADHMEGMLSKLPTDIREVIQEWPEDQRLVL